MKRLRGWENILVNGTGTTASSHVTHTGEKALDENYRFRFSEVEMVPIHLLLSADTPRSMGEDLQHVRLLSSLETVLPPVIVHRPTMRVVDGMHRLQAAVLREEKSIRVRFFDGDERDAFVIAVKENTAHGLPLSVNDRTAAADRIVRSHPHWSDRAIAKIAGLSARTVSNVRRTAFHGDIQPMARLGRDGRVRPLDGSTGRIRAAELIAKEPQASLRQIAQQAGISPSTVRDVRERLRRGEGPLPGPLRSAGAQPRSAPQKRPPTSSIPLLDVPSRSHSAPASQFERDQRRTSPLNILIKDPSLRFGERGRLLLRLLSVSASLKPSWEQLIDAIPEHCVDLVCQVAKESASAWSEFAEDVERRGVRPRVRAEG
ncbi:ParB/RepB/Spo0J family partition protein [Streptosporangium sp. NPDC000396]|uniref:ParB/RepB/Spo0J family partition protein n=1 Tax=Streptosporangium sp. NPDC000396 TaxID=3366185 RepID=UPI003693633D